MLLYEELKKNLNNSITLKILFNGFVLNLINAIHTSILIQNFLSKTNLICRCFLYLHKYSRHDFFHIEVMKFTDRINAITEIEFSEILLSMEKTLIKI